MEVSGMSETEMEYWEAAHEIMLKETLGNDYAAYIAQFESEDYMAFCEAEMV
jgi:hypothetical protein